MHATHTGVVHFSLPNLASIHAKHLDDYDNQHEEEYCSTQVEVQRRTQQRRQQQLDSARRSQSVIWRLLSQGWLRCAYAFADHTRNALILSVFAFKVILCFWSTASTRQVMSGM